MATIDLTNDSDKDICWSRGDTAARVFTIGGANPLDISGSTFLMAVNTEKDPTDVTNQLFSVAGTFVTDGTDGQVQFAPTPATWADTLTLPTNVFYEIQETKGGGAIETLIKGKVKVFQDLNK